MKCISGLNADEYMQSRLAPIGGVAVGEQRLIALAALWFLLSAQLYSQPDLD